MLDYVRSMHICKKKYAYIWIVCLIIYNVDMLLINRNSLKPCRCIKSIKIIMSRGMIFPTMWYMRPAKPKTRLRVWSKHLLVAWLLYSMTTDRASPAGTHCWLNIDSTLIQHHDVESTLNQCCVNGVCLLSHLEFLSIKGGYTDSSESIHFKMPHCCKSHVAAHISLIHLLLDLLIV